MVGMDDSPASVGGAPAPRDARIPGIYSLDEIDDVVAIGDVHDDDLIGQGDEDR